MSLIETAKRHAVEHEKNGQSQNSLEASLRELIMGFRTTQLISVAAKLNLAEHLKDGPKTAEQLCEVIHTNPRGLYRLLRALANLGIFKELDDSTFSTTPAAELLQESSQGSLRSLAILYGEEWLWDAYAELSYSVESGSPAFDFVHGQSLYVYLQQHPIAAAVFHKAMSGYSRSEAMAVIRAYDFSSARMVIDIGGGQGTFLIDLLRANPHLSGIVFDLPAVIEKCRRDLEESSRDLNVACLAGDFFADVPSDGDIYILKSVLHNWDNVACIQILTNCYKVMNDRGRIIVLERVIPGYDEKSEGKLFDINMLVVTGGQERTEQEYKNIFNAAGFRLGRIVQTESPLSILEGFPISKEAL